MKSSAQLVMSSAVALLGVLFLVAPLPPAGAATLEASGWWYRASTATPTAGSPQPIPGGDPTLPVAPPGPPTVAEDQLHVEGAAAGATALAAITIRLAQGESSPVLTITPEPSSVVPPDAVILACRAAIEWSPPASSPGSWESKPLVDCSTSVQAQPAEDGNLVFPLQPLVQGSLVDVVIVPGTLPDRPAEVRGSTFSLTFARPAPDAIATTSGAGSFGNDSFGSGDDFASGDAFTSSELPQLDDAFASPAAPPVDAGVAPALEPQDQGPTVPRIAQPAAVLRPELGAVRILGLVLLLLGAVGAYLTANSPTRTAVGLGRFRHAIPAGVAFGSPFADRPAGGAAEAVERGLGRLRRARTGPSPEL